MKISNVLLIILFCLGFKMMGQNLSVDNDSVFILIDPIYNEIYSFSNEKGSVTIKILKYDKRGLGFETQTKELEDHEIVVVADHPLTPNYYEFRTSIRPIETTSIKDLKTVSIEDISKNDNNVLRNYRGDFYFIEKLDSGDYQIWITFLVFYQ